MHRSIVPAALFVLLAAAFGAAPASALPTDYLFSWGSLGSGNGQFTTPTEIGIADDGSVFVVESGNNRVQKFDADGNFIRKWNSASGAISHLGVDPTGYVYVMGSSNLVQKFNFDGGLSGLFNAGGGSGYGRSIAADRSGHLALAWQSDFGSNFDRYTATGTWLGSFGSGNGFSAPEYDGLGNVFVRSQLLPGPVPKIRKYTIAGAFLLEWGASGSGDGQFLGSGGLGTDAAGNAYVVDGGSYRVQVFDGTGTFLGKFGVQGTGPGQFTTPSDVAVGPSGRIYVVDSATHRIQVYGNGSVPATPVTWGRIKGQYR